MAKKTHELALCGVLCALAVAFLWLSGVIPLSTYAWPTLASATLLPAREECRKSYAWSCFAAGGGLGDFFSARIRKRPSFFAFSAIIPS